MATGEDDKLNNNLDLSEVNAELEDLNRSCESILSDNLVWEDSQAELAYENIAKETRKYDFTGFKQVTSTPIKSAHSYTVPTKSKKSPKSTRSAPVSPSSLNSPVKVQQRITSWEKLIHSETGTIAKTKISPIRRTNTRIATKKGLASPLAAAGDFQRKRKFKPNTSVVARKILKEKKVARKPRVPHIIITMAQPNIARAGRLNPRNRGAGGVGDTVAGLGFPNLETAGISPSGKLIIKKLILLRETIVTNTNIVLRPGGNIQVAIKPLQKYLERTKDIYASFSNTAADIADGNASGLAVMEELISLEDELEGLSEYCETQIANIPVAAAVAGADQIRLSRLNFPTFNGEGNYSNWKTDFEILIVHVPLENVKRTRLLESLEGDAKIYIKSVVTPDKSYDDIIALLEARYNDPLVVNYNLLDRMFNSPDMANPQSTEKHWDNAVGDINAVIASGMGIGEILVYFKLHKFQPETVRRVKMLHKIKYPGSNSINLEEAVFLMNQIVAEEVELKKDSVAIEQTMQSLTMAAVPKVAPKTQPPAVAPITQTQSTLTNQNGGNTNKGTPNYKTPSSNHAPYNNNSPSSYYAPYNNNSPSSYGTPRNNDSPHCHYCPNKIHWTGYCTKYKTVKQKREALEKLGRCPECTWEIKKGNKHKCDVYAYCKHCDGQHKNWLCTSKQPPK